jgi:hypothetical protein
MVIVHHECDEAPRAGITEQDVVGAVAKEILDPDHHRSS